MALVLYWYDFVCFGIVVAAVAVSLWMQWRRELASTSDDNIIYQSLLVARRDTNDYRTVHAIMPRNHVGSSQLWTSCWKGVHPGWLLATRLISFLVMGGLLLTDFLDWDATIFVYYTDQINTPKAKTYLDLARQQCHCELVSDFDLPIDLQVDIYVGFGIFRGMSNTLGTVISAYGCWLSSKKPAASENGRNSVLLKRDVEDIGTTATSLTYMEDESSSAVNLQSHSAEEAILERAGFWGYLMQIIYQVSNQDLFIPYVLYIYKNRYVLWSSSLAIIHQYFCLDLLLNKLSTGSTVVRNSQMKLAVLIVPRALLMPGNALLLVLRSYLYSLLFKQTCAGAVVLTDIVFWCLIVPFLSNTHLGLNALMGCIHSLNAVFLVLETVLNNLPFPWFRIAYFVQWSCLYAIFQWIIHACGFTWWPYSFLELNTPWAPLWYFLVAVIHIPCYGIYALIFKAKNTFFPRLFPRAFVRSF
ncbi:hypothetical protein SADUNF_Sadunf14G0085000 [Salix dunnii]|uniref:Uncharacterized protein n=1 Tax=Salix dunnii TaxID=1413687 RepID=A0A835MTP0_9ROSI|nr:hypothetical protein SADUNF_Sadunf14G0085000 [Salix dunnii]